jgi:hypothetical protein
MELRHELVEYVSGTQGVTCSKDWTIEGKVPNPKI